MQFDRDKFKRLVHYVVWKAGHRPGFGSTKLNKVLWFAEARAFILRGRPITGATFVREKFGPVPKAIMPVRAELVKDGAIEITETPFHNRKTTKFKALRKPDLSGFDSDDLKTVDWWINHIDGDHTAASISEQTHDYAWEIAAMGEELPYHALLAERVRDPKGEEKDWAERRAKELNLP